MTNTPSVEGDRLSLEVALRRLGVERQTGHCGEGNIERMARDAHNEAVDVVLSALFPKGGSGEAEALPIETAPRDCTTLRLLVQFEDHALEDSDGPVWTIGHNNFDNGGEDRWLFAGWCWLHDHYTEGRGKVIGWLPFHAATASTSDAEALVNTYGKAVLRAYLASPMRITYEAEQAAAEDARKVLLTALAAHPAPKDRGSGPVYLGVNDVPLTVGDTVQVHTGEVGTIRLFQHGQTKSVNVDFGPEKGGGMYFPFECEKQPTSKCESGEVDMGWRTALETAQAYIDNLPHGENCFLHSDGGEFDRCFCGKDAMVQYIEDVLVFDITPPPNPVPVYPDPKDRGEGWREALSYVRELVGRIQGWEDHTDRDDQSNWNVYQRALEAIDHALAASPSPRDKAGEGQ